MNETLKEAIYDVIFSRRDIRSQFINTPIPDDVVARVLTAAHNAPSVGFSQPWDFVVIKDNTIKERVHSAFKKANDDSALMFADEKQERYRGFKLEGIKESPLNICITYDKERFGPVVIGRTTNPMMGHFSCVCAVQNLWLAARAEGLGVGWVSVFHENDLRDILSLPEHITPIAYLCIGHVSHFPERPELESAGWLPRLPMENLIHFNQWGGKDNDEWHALTKAIHNYKRKEGCYRKT